ncbi:MAG: phosphoribosylglycinamide formyltransferase [Actinobacteria bacterium]|nr:phosphoribosylglycinamide formyltransferase [Actinomycetota bacterium]
MSDAAAPAIVVLASGSGTLAQAIFDASAADGDFTVAALITDKPQATVVQRAQAAGISVITVPVGDYPDRADWDAALAQVLDEVSPALVVSAGFMRILGAEVLARYAGCIINSHPSLLPLFPGAHAVRDALAAGVTETGTTVHLVDAGMDTGEVLAQVTEPIVPGDTEESLHERIKAHERHLIVAVLRQRLGLSRKTQH